MYDARLSSRDLESITTSADVDTRVIHALGVVGLPEAWDRLSAGAGIPTGQYAWTRASAITFATKSELRVFLGERTPHVTALAPLILRGRVIPRLQMLAADETYEPMDFLYSDSAALAAVTDSLARSGHPILLKRILADSPVIPALRLSFHGRGFVVTNPVAGSPWIPLDPSWSRPEDKLNPGRRSDLRRARKIAERMGAVTFEILSPTASNFADVLQEAFHVELSSWKGRHGTALASDADRGVFYRRYAADACEKGILRVSFLRIGGQAAAMQLAVECGRRYWLLKIGYDQRFHRCSPGTLLVRETVAYAASKGLDTYEFLGIAAPWVETWTQRLRPCVSVRAYPAHPRGAAAFAADLFDFALRRFRRKGER